ncbi:hypothetical protein LTR85_003210 [Meristemomyces frigidus]|nr:hypothetical protein LTR85_003210 [Meristemomyces frigidus]
MAHKRTDGGSAKKAEALRPLFSKNREDMSQTLRLDNDVELTTLRRRYTEVYSSEEQNEENEA